MKNIEKELLYYYGKLKTKKGVTTAQLLDAELDLLECTFGDGCVEINTDDYTYITLTEDNLYHLLSLIDRSKNI